MVSIRESVDHLELIEQASGATRIVIEFWGDGRPRWSTPALPVTVDSTEAMTIDILTTIPEAGSWTDPRAPS